MLIAVMPPAATATVGAKTVPPMAMEASPAVTLFTWPAPRAANNCQLVLVWEGSEFGVFAGMAAKASQEEPWSLTTSFTL